MTSELNAMLLAMYLVPQLEGSRFSPEEFVQVNGCAPADYLEAATYYRGGAGEVGTAYFDWWDPESVENANVDYRVKEFAPGFTVFGSDGGDTAYAFERTSGFIYAFPFIGMTMDGPATFLSKSFEGFLNWLAAHVDE
jgi:hypothetical protein